jgi:uncharacterized protein involved in exopolysaccharide biosynthesis
VPAHARTQSQIEEVLSLVKRRVWQVLTPAVLTAAVGVMLATLLPRKYSTMTRLELVDVSMPLQQAGVENPGFREEVFAAPYQIRSFERVRRVLESLEWEEFEELPPDGRFRYIQRVLRDLRVNPVEVPKTGALFLDIQYSDVDPNRTAQLLNELRDVYVTEKLASVRAQAERLRDELQAGVADDEEIYQQALASYEELQRRHGISPTQQAPGGGRQRTEDPVFERLTRAQQDLLQARTGLAAARGERTKLIEQLEAAPLKVPAADQLERVDIEKELLEIDRAIDAQRALQEGVFPPHSRWKRAQKAIERLEEEKRQLLDRAQEPPPEVRMVPNPDRDDLQARLDATEVQIAGLDGRIAELNANSAALQTQADERSEVYRRLRNSEFQVQLAMDALEITKKEFDRQRKLAEILLQPEFTPFEVTQYAFPPSSPSSPNVPVVIGGATFVGLALGLVFALLAEFGRNGFRGPADIGNTLPVPVLGVVNEIVTTGQQRARTARRALVGTTTLALAAAVLWVTWAYVRQPTLLGPDLVGLLDDMRESFR